jgi:hypothetical protein
MLRFVHDTFEIGAGDSLGSIHAAALQKRRSAADLVSKRVGRAEYPCRNQRLAETRVSIGESLDGHRHAAPVRARRGSDEADSEELDRPCRVPLVVATSPRQASQRTAPSMDPVVSKRANASRWYEFAAARSPARRAVSPMPLKA